MGTTSDVIELDKIFAIEEFKDLSHDNFVDACILSGCDYMENLAKIGLKKALKLIKEFKTIEKVVESLKEKKEYEGFDFEDYVTRFKQTQKFFKYYPVYDPKLKSIVSLNELPEGELPLGETMNPVTLQKFVKGLINPYTMQERKRYKFDMEMILKDFKKNIISVATFNLLQE